MDGGWREVRTVMRRKTGGKKEERLLYTLPRQAGMQAIIRVCNRRAYYGQSKCVCACVCVGNEVSDQSSFLETGWGGSHCRMTSHLSISAVRSAVLYNNLILKTNTSQLANLD